MASTCNKLLRHRIPITPTSSQCRQISVSIPTTYFKYGCRRSAHSASCYSTVANHPSPDFVTTNPSRRKLLFLTSYLPRIFQASLYKNILFPYWFTLPSRKKKKREWNPYTFFIVIFMFMGSNAINMIALKHEHREYMRRAETKIDLLREVIESVKRGEMTVEEVERVLGTGEEKSEREWEDVLREIEEEDAKWDEARKKAHKEKKEVELRGRERDVSKEVGAQGQMPSDKAASFVPSASSSQGKKLADRDYFF